MRQQRILPFFSVFIVASFVFYLGSSRDSGFGPGGVLTAILATGGLPNPPGYQWIAILGHLWMKIPHENAFAHLNTLGVLIAGVWAALFSLTGLRIVSSFFPELRNPWRWMLAMLPLLGCLSMPLFWRHIYFFERYLFANLLLFVLIELWNLSSERLGRGAAFGLGVLIPALLWAHGFVFLVGMFISVWWAWRLKIELQTRWRWVFSGLILGSVFPPLACAVLAKKSTALLNWGDPSSWKNFVDVLTRDERAGESLARPYEMLLRQLELFGATLQIQVGISLALVFGLICFAVVRGRSPIFSGALNATRWIDVGTVALSLSIPLGMINFSLGPTGSDLEKNVQWVTDNYLLTFFCLLSVYGFTGLLVFLRDTGVAFKQGNIRVAIGVLAVLLVFMSGQQAWKNRSQGFEYASSLLQVIRDLYPPGSLVLTSIDSIYFPWVGSVKEKEGPILLHTDMLFRPWYIERILVRDWFSEVEKGFFRVFLADLLKYSRQEIGPKMMLESYLNMIDGLVSSFELKHGAFVIEVPQIGGAMRYGFAGWHTKEPWGLGMRLFKTQSEVTPLDWKRVSRAREVLAGAEVGPQGFWMRIFAEVFSSDLERRHQWIKNVFPEEAEELREIRKVPRP